MILLQLAQRLHGERNKRVQRCVRAVLLEMRNADGKFVGFVVLKKKNFDFRMSFGRVFFKTHLEGNVRGEFNKAVALSTVCKI